MAAWWLDREAFSELISPNPRTLRVIVGLQLLESLAQVLVVCIALLLGVVLPVIPLLAIILLFAIWNGLSWWRTRRLPANADCERRVMNQLLVATLTLAGLLYFTGGATSPFVSLFLVPVAIGALCLSMPLALVITGVAAVAYTGLLFFHVPLAAQHVHGEAGFNFHVIGMWLNFLGSAVVLLVFLGLLARANRERASDLAELRERQMRGEQVMAMAGVAAGAAHALATPLSTLSILLDELDDAGAASADVQLARGQLEVVRERLDEILRSAGTGVTPGQENVRTLVNRLTRQWHGRRPEADLRVDAQLPDMPAQIDPALGHGLITLLDNAADANVAAGTTRVLLRVRAADGRLEVEVEDEGGGPLPSLDNGGTTKQNGHGAGLMILRTNLERLGGMLKFVQGTRGSVARLSLPLQVIPA